MSTLSLPISMLETLDLDELTLLRPYAIVRIGGVPIRSISELRPPEFPAMLQNICEGDCAIGVAREDLSQRLHSAIGAINDRRVRGRLIELRRTLYQDKCPAIAILVAAQAALSAPLWDTVAAAVVRFRARDDAIASFRLAYAKALLVGRERLRQMLSDPDFQKGLLISSTALFRNLARFRTLPPAKRSSRDEQIERGLLRYLTRAAMKATPFARFCALAQGSFVEGGASGMIFDGDPALKVGHVRLNKSLYGLLWGHLKTRPSVRRSLVIDVNPTLEASNSRLVFLASVDGSEVFQRIAGTDAVDALLALIQSGHSMTLGSLAAALASHPLVDATLEDALAYLDGLLRIGLLRFRSFVPEQEVEWDRALGAALSVIDDEHAQRIASVLGRVSFLASAYQVADVAARMALAEQIREEISEALSDLGLVTRIPRDLPFFEDASTQTQVLIGRTQPVEAAFRQLREWIALTQPIAQERAQQATMRQFFDAQYPPGTTVPLLRFYEAFSRDRVKPPTTTELSILETLVGGSQAEQAEASRPLVATPVGNLRAAHMRLTELVRARWAEDEDAEIIAIKPDELLDVTRSVMPDAPPTVCRSASVFCQLAARNGHEDETMLVVSRGQYFVGYGKYLSRFLYMMPAEMQRSVYEDNVTLADSVRLAEISSDADFNGNLHPPLVPWTISYPTGEADSATRQIASVDLEVQVDPDDSYALRLVHRASGDRVIPVDLGFLNPRMRPPFYQLLMRFTPGGAFGIGLPETPFRLFTETTSLQADSPSDASAAETHQQRASALPNRVVVRPRIVFGDRLVLARRRWSVPGALVPRLLPREDGADYMVRVNRWRSEHGIPTDVYVRVIPNASPKPTGTAETQPSKGEQKEVFDTDTDGDRDAADSALGTSQDTDVNDLADEQAADEQATGTGSAHDGHKLLAQKQFVRPSRDLAKPQYIDFSSPLLVSLFSRLFGTVQAFRLYIEESYPDKESIPTYRGDGYVAELIVQVDLPAVTPTRARPDVERPAAVCT